MVQPNGWRSISNLQQIGDAIRSIGEKRRNAVYNAKRNELMDLEIAKGKREADQAPQKLEDMQDARDLARSQTALSGEGNYAMQDREMGIRKRLQAPTNQSLVETKHRWVEKRELPSADPNTSKAWTYEPVDLRTIDPSTPEGAARMRGIQLQPVSQQSRSPSIGNDTQMADTRAMQDYYLKGQQPRAELDAAYSKSEVNPVVARQVAEAKARQAMLDAEKRNTTTQRGKADQIRALSTSLEAAISQYRALVTDDGAEAGAHLVPEIQRLQAALNALGDLPAEQQGQQASAQPAPPPTNVLKEAIIESGGVEAGVARFVAAAEAAGKQVDDATLQSSLAELGVPPAQIQAVLSKHGPQARKAAAAAAQAQKWEQALRADPERAAANQRVDTAMDVRDTAEQYRRSPY